MRWLRYHFWMMNCPRYVWFDRVFDAHRAGYSDMYRYWDEQIRGKQ